MFKIKQLNQNKISSYEQSIESKSETEENEKSKVETETIVPKLSFRDKLLELSTKNDSNSNILKRIFTKNYADKTEEYNTKRQIYIYSKNKSSGYYNRIK